MNLQALKSVLLKSESIERFMMKTLRFTGLLLVSVSLFGCGGGSSTLPNDVADTGSSTGSTTEPVSNLQGEHLTVSADGGEYEIDGLKLKMPSGIVSEDKTLIVAKDDSEGSFTSWTLSGLRKFQSGAIELALPIPSGIDPSQLAAHYKIKQGCYAKSISGMIDCDVQLTGRVDADRYIVNLPVMNATPKKRARSALIDAAEISAEVSNDIYSEWNKVADEQEIQLHFVSYDYSTEHFQVHSNDVSASMSMIDTIEQNISPALEYAYTLLKNFGFDMTKLPQTIHVYIKTPNILNGLKGNLGMANIFPFADPYINLNVKELENKKLLWATIGHEFFHIVQSYALPDYWSNDLITEASSVWFEKYAADDTQYKDDSYKANVAASYRNFPVYGLSQKMVSKSIFETGEKIETAAELGYGLSIFFNYLDSPGLVKAIYSNKANKQSDIKAIENAVKLSGYSLEERWNSFLAYDYMATDKVIPIDYLAEYSLTVKTPIDNEPFKKTFMMGPYSGLGIYLRGKTANDTSPDFSSVLIHYTGNQVRGQWNNLDGTTYWLFNASSKEDHLFTVSREGINSEEVFILSNPTDQTNTVTLEVSLLMGSSCPRTAEYPGITRLSYRSAENAYVDCMYSSGGSLQGEYPYVNNKKEGIVRTFLNGLPKSEITYAAGLQEGIQKTYDNSGNETGCYIFSGGIFVKECQQHND